MGILTTAPSVDQWIVLDWFLVKSGRQINERVDYMRCRLALARAMTLEWNLRCACNVEYHDCYRVPWINIVGRK